jgi:4-hydroxybenzoate polyprenyltransferase
LAIHFFPDRRMKGCRSGHEEIHTMLNAVLQSLRPLQWVKNGFILAPMLFSHNMLNRAMFFPTLSVLVLFSLLCSAVYLFNDLIDIEHDRAHPVKRNRPIAAGRLSVRAAWVVCLALAGIVFLLTQSFFPIVMGYFLSYGALNIFYSLFLKRLVIIDVMVIALGFVLRVLMGGAVNRLEVTPWILLMTFTLAVLLGLAKRRSELVRMALGQGGHPSRKTLESYSIELLNTLITIATTATLLGYMIFITLPQTQVKFARADALFWTVPFVCFGLFRYLYLTFERQMGENPAQVLFSDAPFLANAMLWLGLFGYIIYL